MQYRSFQVQNYKCFLDSGSILLAPGINIVIGENSAGKSALLSAMKLPKHGIPHKSIETKPLPEFDAPGASWFGFSINMTSRDIKLHFQTNQLYMPFPTKQAIAAYGMAGTSPEKFIEWIVNDHSSLTISVQGYNNNFNFPDNPDSLPYGVNRNATEIGYCSIAFNDQRFHVVKTMNASWEKACNLHNAIPTLASTIFRFDAERMRLSRCQSSEDTKLVSDASNLAAVIANMRKGPVARTEQFMEAVRFILPQVHEVITRPFGNSEEIQIIPKDPKMVDYSRSDLAYSLADCGSGVSQVLSIVYAVVSETYPTVFLIDEPQSYLHPGALQRLLDFLEENTQHQYVLATHSTTVIGRRKISTLTHIRADGPRSTAKSVDSGSVEDLKSIMYNLGARLSDVFGADHVLYVEGPTEEQAFKEIIRAFDEKLLRGLSIIGLSATGDIDGKSRKAILRIYEKVTTCDALIPPALGILLDREFKPDQEMNQILKDSKNLIRFSRLPMFENYILNADAICAIYNEDALVNDLKPTTPLAVKQRLGKMASNPRYKCSDSPSSYRSLGHASNLLESLFVDLSGTKHIYRKLEHSPRICRWLLANNPEELKPLFEELRSHIAST